MKQRPILLGGIYPMIDQMLNMEVKEVKELSKILADEYGVSRSILSKPLGTEVKVRTEPKIGRNEPCKCGSGLKFKKCCIHK